MGPQRTPYLLLFCLSAALLLLAAVFSPNDAHDAPHVGTSTPRRPVDPQPLRSAASLQPSLAPLRAVARHFLGAFLRYEVSDLSETVRIRLRRTADRRFADELLSRPPRGFPASRQARIVALRITRLSTSPPRALVSGSARRAGQVEQFSFLFEAAHGAWRCVGPGE